MRSKTCNCVNCNKPIFGRYFKKVNGDTLCDYCVELECFQCDGCNSYFYMSDINYMGEPGGSYYCDDCAGKYTTFCDECEQELLVDEARYVNGGCYCGSCAWEIEHNSNNLKQEEE